MPLNLQKGKKIIKFISILTIIFLLIETYIIGQIFGLGILGTIVGEAFFLGIFGVILFPYRWLKKSRLVIMIPMTLCFNAVLLFEFIRIGEDKYDFTKFNSFIAENPTATNLDALWNDPLINKENLEIYSKVFNHLLHIRQEIQSIILQYDQFVKNHIGDILEIKNMANKDQRVLYKERLVETNHKLRSYQEQIKELTEYKRPSSLLALPITTRARIIQGMKEAKDNIRKEMNRFFDLEMRTTSIFYDLYLFLDENEGQFTIQEGQIVFNNEDALEKFNYFYTSLEELDKEREQNL